jgi:hypothetical protein
MKSRKQILVEIFNLEGDLDKLQNEILNYPWDSENTLLIICKSDMAKVISKFIQNESLLLDIEKWANLLECRGDVEYKPEELKEYIFEFANPYLYGETTKNRLQEIINELQVQTTK